MPIVSNIIRLLAILTVASVFLAGLFGVHLPFPFRVAHFYFLLWIPVVFIYDYRLLLNKNLLMVLVFVIIMYVGLGLFWEDRIFRGDTISFVSIIMEIIPFFGAVLMYLYFLKSEDQKGLRIVIYLSFLFIVITTILTIRGLMIEPMAVRFAMSGRTDLIDLDVSILGIGGYGFFNGIMLLMPAMAYFMNKPEYGVIKKTFILLFVAFAIYPMVLAGITTTFLLAVVIFIYAAFFVKKFKAKLYIPIIIIVSGLFVLNHLTADLIHFISQQINESVIKTRLEDLSTTVRLMDFSPEEADTYFARVRLALTLQSLQGFLANPLIGTGDSGGHSYWLDRLAMFGLVGWFPILMIFYQQVKLQKITLLNAHYPYFLVSIYAILLFGIMKGNVVSPQTMVVLFFLVPGIFLLEIRNDST